MRFYQPGQSQYISQFAQLPLDWMYENIKSQQAERDAAMSELGSQTYPIEHLVQGLRGYEQGQGEFAKEIATEYDQENDSITNMIITDPRSSNRAKAALAKLDNKFKNDQRIIRLKQNKDSYEATMKQYNEAIQKGYAADIYKHRQNLSTFNPKDAQGNIAAFIPDSEFGLKRDYEKTLISGTAGIRDDSESWARLQQYGDIGLQQKEGYRDYVSSGKVQAVASGVASWFFPTDDGQYWLDNAFTDAPELRKYYPNEDYHVNAEEMKSIRMDINGEPLKKSIYKEDADGNIVYGKDKKPIKTGERDVSVYEYAADKLAGETYNLNMRQIGEQERQHTGISQFSDARVEGMKPGVSSYDQAPGITTRDIVGDVKYEKSTNLFEDFINSFPLDDEGPSTLSNRVYAIDDPALFIAHASTVLGPKMAKKILYDKDGNPKITAKGSKIISTLTKADYALLEDAQKDYDRQEATLHKVNEDKTSGRLTTSQTLSVPGGVYATGNAGTSSITTTADKILSTQFNAPIISSTANPNYKGSLRDVITEFIEDYDTKDISKITISMNGTANEANHFGNTDMWTIAGPDGKSETYRAPSHRLDIVWEDQPPLSQYYESLDNFAANMGIASKYQNMRTTSYIPLGFQSTKAFLQKGLYAASTEAQKDYFDGSRQMYIKTDILGSGQVEVSVYDPSSGTSKKITHIYDGSDKKIPLNITNVRQLENKDLSTAIFNSVLGK